VRQYLIGPPGPPGPPGVPGGYGFNTQEVAGRVLNLINGRKDTMDVRTCVTGLSPRSFLELPVIPIF